MDLVTRGWGTVVYAPPSCIHGESICLPEDEAHHLYHVLRARQGESVVACDGDGTGYRCTVNVDLSLQIAASIPSMGELPFELQLFSAVLKGDSARDIVDTATQLGVTAIRFVSFERCEGHMSAERLDKLRRVAISAMKQCGRSTLPEISVCRDARSALNTAPVNSRWWISHPCDGDAVPNGAVEDSPVQTEVLVVGPEGGLTDHEVKLMMSQRSRILDLGRRRLRATLAVAAGLSHLLTVRGEFRG